MIRMKIEPPPKLKEIHILCALVICVAGLVVGAIVTNDWLGKLVGAVVALFGTLIIASRLFPFHCPQCGRKLYSGDMTGTELGEPILFVCPVCQIEWDTGYTVED